MCLSEIERICVFLLRDRDKKEQIVSLQLSFVTRNRPKGRTIHHSAIHSCSILVFEHNQELFVRIRNFISTDSDVNLKATCYIAT